MLGLCKNRFTEGMFGSEPCPRYEMNECNAKDTKCSRYEDRTDEELYCPSATRGDYSPSCPWNAPGMKVSDFI